MRVHACARACDCVCVRVCACARVRLCVCTCARALPHAHGCMLALFHACTCCHYACQHAEQHFHVNVCDCRGTRAALACVYYVRRVDFMKRCGQPARRGMFFDLQSGEPFAPRGRTIAGSTRENTVIRVGFFPNVIFTVQAGIRAEHIRCSFMLPVLPHFYFYSM